MWPAYFRHSRENDETGEDLYLSKLYLHALPPGDSQAAGGTSLCVRFSLAARDDAEIYDLALKVLHLQAPAGRHFHLSRP